PQAVEHGRKLAREAGIDDVVTHRAGNALVDSLGRDYDVILLANVAHHFSTRPRQVGRVDDGSARDPRASRSARGGGARGDAESPGELVYWALMPSGMLRHPLFVRWMVESLLQRPRSHLDTATFLAQFRQPNEPLYGRHRAFGQLAVRAGRLIPAYGQ